MLCFLLVAEVFATLTTDQEEEEDDPEVASAIVPEISVKKKNQPGCHNKVFCSFKETVCLCLRNLSIIHLCWNSLLKSIFIN